MKGRELVKKAIKSNRPERLPMLFFNSDKDQSDILMIDAGLHFMGEDKDKSEWGFQWKRIDETMGQPIRNVIEDWEAIDSLRTPLLNENLRFAHTENEIDKYGSDKYLLANLELTGFTVMSLIRGFENIVVDLIDEPVRSGILADMVFDHECEIIKAAKRRGFDGIAFFDDWGTQNDLIISPAMWREFFKERYRKQFQLVHELGMDVYFHSCGYIYPIINDLIEAGVDMLNISQPNLYDIRKLGKDFGGKVCFVCPVSYQTTSISGTREDIFDSVCEIVKSLGGCGGGLIGYIEEYRSIGMSMENYQNCIDAFRKYGNYAKNRKLS